MQSTVIYKYNPDLIADDELTATFVAREPILKGVLEDLKTRIEAKSNQHYLIIGPRGIGKSNLLLMIKIGLSKDRILSKAYLTLKTAEEEYSITSLRDFFVRIIELILEADTESKPAPEFENIKSLKDDELALDSAIQLVKNFCADTGKKIILLMDSLDLILGEQITDEAEIGRLRDVLMNESFLILVGTASTFFNEVSGYDRPFYNFFKIITLEELSFEQFYSLLKKRAEWEDNRPVMQRLDEIEPRLEAIFHLSGGNPRLALMVYQLIAQSDLLDVRSALESLLEELTPYYKHRIESLSPQQRKVMTAFADFGRPATPKELSESTRIPANQISGVIQRLKDDGFVEVAPQKRRRTTLYIVSEQLFRIWHQMRFSTSSRRKIDFLIEFIRIWYTKEEWQAEIARLLDLYVKSMSDKCFDIMENIFEHLEYLTEGAPDKKHRLKAELDIINSCIDSGDYDRADGLLKHKIELCEKSSDKISMICFLFLSAILNYKRGNYAEGDHIHDKLEKSIRVSASVISFYGELLFDFGMTKSGKERTVLMNKACEKFSIAVEMEPDNYRALEGWFLATASIATIANKSTIVKSLYSVMEKYEEAMITEPLDNTDYIIYYAMITMVAYMEDGENQEKLIEKVIEGLENIRGFVAATPKEHSLYSIIILVIYRYLSYIAYYKRNFGDIRYYFIIALKKFPLVDQSIKITYLQCIFKTITTPETYNLSDEFLGMLRERGMEDELELLEPFRIAIEYWQKGNDEEVLDRLNPEMREIVTQIISKGDKE